MHRNVVITIIALGTVALSVDTSLAFGSGGAGRFGPPMASVAAAAPHTSSGSGTATPLLRKLSPKAAGACYRACMHGMDSGWDNFCGYSCY
jgi:hypothetical protein